METSKYYTKKKANNNFVVYHKVTEHGKSHSTLVGTYPTQSEAESVKEIYGGNPPSCSCGGNYYWFDDDIHGSPLFRCDSCENDLCD
jgi:hypothetical protein